jgi:hypothetical protein
MTLMFVGKVEFDLSCDPAFFAEHPRDPQDHLHRLSPIGNNRNLRTTSLCRSTWLLPQRGQRKRSRGWEITNVTIPSS